MTTTRPSIRSNRQDASRPRPGNRRGSSICPIRQLSPGHSLRGLTVDLQHRLVGAAQETSLSPCPGGTEAPLLASPPPPRRPTPMRFGLFGGARTSLGDQPSDSQQLYEFV